MAGCGLSEDAFFSSFFCSYTSSWEASYNQCGCLRSSLSRYDQKVSLRDTSATDAHRREPDSYLCLEKYHSTARTNVRSSPGSRPFFLRSL